MAKNKNSVTVGDTFQKTDATKWSWEVELIFTPIGHPPHARIYRRDFPSETRVFSVSALLEQRLFRRIAHLGAKENRSITLHEHAVQSGTKAEGLKKAS